MHDFEVKFYEKADGTKPAKNFILGLAPKMRAKTLKIIDFLEANGSDLRALLKAFG